MRWRALAFLLLGVDLLLAGGWWLSARPWPAAPRRSSLALGQTPDGPAKPNILVRRQFFSWREVESPDYPTYIANLRDIGCPEQTIRDIIIADVNALYTQKRATNLVTAEQQWWRSEPDTEVVEAATEKARALEDERKALLARLLGPRWEAGDIVNLPRPTRQGILLDGPVLGTLPAETKQSIEEINFRTQDRLQAYLDQQRADGKTPDPVELAKLRQQTRTELERILTPPQLEEFLLRYSQNANNLRAEFGQLQFFNPSPDEFRNIFRSTDNYDQQMQLLADATDANSVAQRKILEQQRENSIKLALGPARYEQYRLLHDPIYRDAVAAADQAGTPEAVRTIYEINVATAAEQERIREATNLTAEQKSVEMKRIELEQLKANTVATGNELPPEPAAAAQPPPKKTYVVRPGDSAAMVSLIYGLSVNALRAANPNLDFTRLKPGDAIEIPPTGISPVLGP